MRKKTVDSWTVLNNEVKTVEDEELTFTAINLPSGKLVDKWTIGKTTVENKETVEYKIKKITSEAKIPQVFFVPDLSIYQSFTTGI